MLTCRTGIIFLLSLGEEAKERQVTCEGKSTKKCFLNSSPCSQLMLHACLAFASVCLKYTINLRLFCRLKLCCIWSFHVVLQRLAKKYTMICLRVKFNNGWGNHWKPLFALISVRILLKQLDYELDISMRG